MPKNITIYIPDSLVREMDELPEVNWSEVARNAIELYVKERKQGQILIEELEAQLDQFQVLNKQIENFMQQSNKTNIIYNEVPVHSYVRLDERKNKIKVMFNIENKTNKNYILDRIIYSITIRYRKEKTNTFEKIEGFYLERVLVNPPHIVPNREHTVPEELVKYWVDNTKKDDKKPFLLEHDVKAFAYLDGDDGLHITWVQPKKLEEVDYENDIWLSI